MRAIRSAFVMGDVPRRLVHALKYRGWEAAAAPMAARMAAADWPADVLDEAGLVVPVPTSATRKRERGYNQAEALAREFARRTGRVVGINGFGRIGRNVLRAPSKCRDRDIDFVAVNDLTDTKTLAHLLKYDSVLGDLSTGGEGRRRLDHGRRRRDQGARREGSGEAAVEGPRRRRRARVDRLLHRRATRPPSTSTAARRRSSSPRRRRTRTSPSCWASTTTSTTAKHHIISNASCTTNCLAPMAKVLHDNFGIKKGWMTTVHAYTNDQNILDLPHKDLRRARAAALSIIPTTDRRRQGGRLVLPELKGKLDGIAMRVPTPDGSVVDLAVARRSATTVEEVNAAFRAAADGPAEGHPAVRRDEPLVSIDFIGNPHSCIFDAPYTKVMDGDLVKVSAGTTTSGATRAAASTSDRSDERGGRTRALGDGEVLLLENTRFLGGEEKNDERSRGARGARRRVRERRLRRGAPRALVHRRRREASEGPARRGRAADGEGARVPGRRARESRSGRSWRFSAARRSRGRSTSSRRCCPRSTAADRRRDGQHLLQGDGARDGKSLVEDDRVEMARELLSKSGGKLVLPSDCVVTDRLEAGAAKDVVSRDAIPAAAWRPTSGPGRWRSTARSFRRPGRCSGTGPWACSRSPSSPAAPAAWPRPWRKRPTTAPRPSSAAATRPPRWRRWGWRSACRTCPPAAGRRSSSWKGRSFPACSPR
jgi:glyceraldehyde 3-phosphate dehydrogenase